MNDTAGALLDTLSVSGGAVPEPSSAALFAFGILLVLFAPSGATYAAWVFWPVPTGINRCPFVFLHTLAPIRTTRFARSALLNISFDWKSTPVLGYTHLLRAALEVCVLRVPVSLIANLALLTAVTAPFACAQVSVSSSGLNQWTLAAAMNAPRAQACSAILQDGSMLVAGVWQLRRR